MASSTQRLEDVSVSKLVKLLEALHARAHDSATKSRLLSKFWSIVPPRGNIYSVFRLVLPELDSERKYSLKEKTLARALVKLFPTAPAKERSRLHPWTEGGGDLGEAFATMMLKYPMPTGLAPGAAGLSIRELNELLDRISAYQLGVGGQDDGTTLLGLLGKLFSRVSPASSAWVVRMILKNVPTASSVEWMSSFDPDMPRLHSWHGLLRQTCRLTMRYLARLSAAGKGANTEAVLASMLKVTPGSFVEPELASRSTGVVDVWKKFQNKWVAVERKFDGERIQIHLWGGGASLSTWSRHGLSTTNRYDSIAPFVKAAVGASMSQEDRATVAGRLGTVQVVQTTQPFQSCVLDGEIVVWDTVTGAAKPWGDNQNKQAGGGFRGGQFRLGVNGPRQHLAVHLFDILEWNGRDLTCETLATRKKILSEMSVDVGSFVNRVPSVWLSLPSLPSAPCGDYPEPVGVLASRFASAIAARHEGLVVKAAESAYTPRGRGGWMKLKRDYVPGLGDTLDLVLVGVRTKVRDISSLALAVLDDREGMSTGDGVCSGLLTWRIVTMVGSGLSASRQSSLAQYLSQVATQAVSLESRNIPGSGSVVKTPMGRVLLGARAQWGQDMRWIGSMDDLLVVEVLCSELQRCGPGEDDVVTLRHPRIVKIKSGAPWRTAMTMTALMEAVGHAAATSTSPTSPVKAGSSEDSQSSKWSLSPSPGASLLSVAPPELHFGVACAACGMEPIVGRLTNTNLGGSFRSLCIGCASRTGITNALDAAAAAAVAPISAHDSVLGGPHTRVFNGGMLTGPHPEEALSAATPQSNSTATPPVRPRVEIIIVDTPSQHEDSLIMESIGSSLELESRPAKRARA